MKSFKENNCRLCTKTFCCRNCRCHHEETFHDINPDCEICVYGRATINEASVSLLNHIKSVHWPLHCVFCNKIFNSLDELIPHDKCALRIDNMKIHETPKTPGSSVNEQEQPSPEVTPFYKNIKSGNQQIGTTAFTSTPLVRKEENVDKITPINQSQISCTHKSNLKLTGSSNLSDSKKSERRVTFSETPSVSEAYKKPKYLPLAKQIEDSPEDAEDDLSDDSYVSVEEIFKTAPNTNSEIEEKENQDNQAIIFKDKCDSSGTLWESALTKLDFNASNIVEPVNNQFNVSLQINVFNNTLKSVDDSNLNGNDVENTALNKPTNIWSSMTNMVKSVVHNISVTAQSSLSNVGIKRSYPEIDASDVPSIKRMKLTELRCRRSIRDLRPLHQIRLARPRYADKATQTDEIWM